MKSRTGMAWMTALLDFGDLSHDGRVASNATPGVRGRRQTDRGLRRLRLTTRTVGSRLALGVVAALLAAGCGGGGSQSLDSISSCLKSKQFTVKRSGPNRQLKSLGFLTVNDDNLDVLMTVEVFQDTKAAKFSYDYSRSTHEKATIRGKVVLTGDKKGPGAQKFDSCIS